MIHPKPGPKKKSAKIKNKAPRLHDINPPKEKHCRCCGLETGTECYRHAESRLIKFLCGGGIMGGKIPDSMTGWMCALCDHKLSDPLPKDTPEIEVLRHAWEWSMVIFKTHLLD